MADDGLLTISLRKDNYKPTSSLLLLFSLSLSLSTGKHETICLEGNSPLYYLVVVSSQGSEMQV